MTMEMNLGYLK